MGRDICFGYQSHYSKPTIAACQAPSDAGVVTGQPLGEPDRAPWLFVLLVFVVSLPSGSAMSLPALLLQV